MYRRGRFKAESFQIRMSEGWTAEVLPFRCKYPRLMIAVVGIELIVVCVGAQANLHLDC